MSADNSDHSAWRRLLLWGSVAVVVLGAAGFGWWVWKSKKPDMVAVLQVNNRGVAQMDQYDYIEAAKAFEEVVQMAPDWLPGKINLGIAVLNRDQGKGNEARRLFEEVLAKDPDNP